MTQAMETVYQTILARKSADPKTSYVAKLLAKGHTHIAKKLGEEAVETAIASAQNDRSEVIYESADLLFHLSVLWAAHDITPEEVFAELARREGTSGIEEKASRTE